MRDYCSGVLTLKPDPQLLGRGRVDVGVVDDKVHVPGFGQPEDLGANVADADRTERLAHQPDTVVVGLLRPPALAGQPVLDQEFAGLNTCPIFRGHLSSWVPPRKKPRKVLIPKPGPTMAFRNPAAQLTG